MTVLCMARYTLQVRQPVSEDSLGPWQELVSVTVISQIDNTAPVFEGIIAVEVQTVKGFVPITPCHYKEDWVVETKLILHKALDPPYPAEELVYVLERRSPDKNQWELVKVFYPGKDKENMMIEWQSHSRNAWDKLWIYRTSVRDLAGNMTIGAQTITVQNPAEPE